MGETATDTRHEIEATRAQLGDTIDAARSRVGGVRQKAVRTAATGGGVVAAAAVATVGVVIAVRRSRRGPLTRAARHLPAPAQQRSVAAARSVDAWASRRAKRMAARRSDLADAVASRVADHQATADRRANPIWRRGLQRAVETAATAGVAALVKTAIQRTTSPASKKN